MVGIRGRGDSKFGSGLRAGGEEGWSAARALQRSVLDPAPPFPGKDQARGGARSSPTVERRQAPASNPGDVLSAFRDRWRSKLGAPEPPAPAAPVADTAPAPPSGRAEERAPSAEAAPPRGRRGGEEEGDGHFAWQSPSPKGKKGKKAKRGSVSRSRSPRRRSGSGRRPPKPSAAASADEAAAARGSNERKRKRSPSSSSSSSSSSSPSGAKKRPDEGKKGKSKPSPSRGAKKTPAAGKTSKSKPSLAPGSKKKPVEGKRKKQKSSSPSSARKRSPAKAKGKRSESRSSSSSGAKKRPAKGQSSKSKPPPRTRSSSSSSDSKDAEVHEGVECGKCKVEPVRGPCFRCRSCEAFNLCKRCYPARAEFHAKGHKFFVAKVGSAVAVAAKKAPSGCGDTLAAAKAGAADAAVATVASSATVAPDDGSANPTVSTASPKAAAPKAVIDEASSADAKRMQELCQSLGKGYASTWEKDGAKAKPQKADRDAKKASKKAKEKEGSKGEQERPKKPRAEKAGSECAASKPEAAKPKKAKVAKGSGSVEPKPEAKKAKKAQKAPPPGEGKGDDAPKPAEADKTKQDRVAGKLLPKGFKCSQCRRKSAEDGAGVVCRRRRPDGTDGGCNRGVCWQCMKPTPDDALGKIRTTKEDFKRLGKKAWWMHEACLVGADETDYFVMMMPAPS